MGDLRLKDLVVAVWFFFMGSVIMSIGYFTGYSEARFVVYLLAILLFGAIYVIYFGFFAPPQTAVYIWLAALLLFPQKELRPALAPVLANSGFGAADAYFSLFDVLDVFFVLAMLIAALKMRRARPRKRWRTVQILDGSIILLICIGLTHMIWFGGQSTYLEYGLWRMFTSWWEVVVALAVLRSASVLIRTRRQVETLFFIGIAASIILLTEFILISFSLLPDAIAHYGINPRGGFQGILLSNDLLVGLVEVFGVGAACYAFVVKGRRGRLRYLILAVLSVLVVQQTFYRGPTLSTILAGLVFFVASSRKMRWRTVGAGIAIVGTLLFTGALSGGSPADWFGEVLNSGVKDRSLYDTRSSLARLGAVARGIDVFRHNPWLGAGPGNVVLSMASSAIPSYTLGGSISGFSQTFYDMIQSGEHPTNPHNLIIMLLAEYGILAALAVLSAFMVGIALVRSIFGRSGRYPRSLYLARAVAFSMLLAYMAYYVLQATPYFFGMMALLVVIGTLRPDDWLAAGAGALRSGEARG